MTDAMSQEQLYQWIKKTARAAMYVTPTEPVVQVSALRALFAGRRLVQAGEAFTLCDIKAAFEAEIAKVSQVEYNSNAICRKFFSEVLKRLHSLALQPASPDKEVK